MPTSLPWSCLPSQHTDRKDRNPPNPPRCRWGSLVGHHRNGRRGKDLQHVRVRGKANQIQVAGDPASVMSIGVSSKSCRPGSELDTVIAAVEAGGLEDPPPHCIRPAVHLDELQRSRHGLRFWAACTEFEALAFFSRERSPSRIIQWIPSLFKSD